MAIRQAGVIKIKGRIGSDLVGYKMKGVDGVLVRTFDGQRISEAVKNSPNYANTRKNNAEFGAAASTAKALYNAIPQKWRTVLQSFVLAKLQRNILFYTRGANISSPYGQRSLGPGLLGDRIIPSNMNEFSKRAFCDFVGSYVLDGVASTMTFDDAMLLAGKYAQGGEYDGLHIYVTGRYTVESALIGPDGTILPSKTTTNPGVASMTSVAFSTLSAPVVIANVEGWKSVEPSVNPDQPAVFQLMCAVPYKLINDDEVEFINDASFAAIV